MLDVAAMPEGIRASKQSSKNPYIRTSLQKAFHVLNLFSVDTPTLRLSDISKALGISPSSLYPILHTLEHSGYLRRDDDRRYSLGLKLLERTNVLLESLDLRDKAKPHLKTLANDCQANAHLAIRNGWMVLYLEREVAGPDVVFSYILGRQTPIHCTALGKAILAHQPDDLIEAFLGEVQLEPKTPNTIVSPERFRDALSDVRTQGYAIDDEELHSGVMCVAAPVFDYADQVVAAISISFPKTEATTEQLNALIERTTDAAGEISQSMGALGQGTA